VACFTSADICSTTWLSWGEAVVSWVCGSPDYQQSFTIEPIEEYFDYGYDCDIWSFYNTFNVYTKKTVNEKGQESLVFCLRDIKDPVLFLDAVSNDFACQVIGKGIIHTERRCTSSIASRTCAFLGINT
jgi:hypothetical protein